MQTPAMSRLQAKMGIVASHLLTTCVIGLRPMTEVASKRLNFAHEMLTARSCVSSFKAVPFLHFVAYIVLKEES